MICQGLSRWNSISRTTLVTLGSPGFRAGKSPAFFDLRGLLRSKDPAGVLQEMWALFAVYQAICRVVGIAVNAAGIPPAQISFPHALAAAKDSVAAFSP